jgi:hypothetical protein
MFGLFTRPGTPNRKRQGTRHRKSFFEPLETRDLLSAAGLADLSQISALPMALVAAPYTPAEVTQAYGFSKVMFGSIKGDGAGQTIAIVDAYDDPKALSDLKAFDVMFGLPDPVFQKVSQTGSTTALPAANASWGLEIALDIEWAHAVAPAAKILLVEANSSYLSDLLTAVNYAATQASVVSMSWGSSEFSSETAYDSYFSPQSHPGVTFVAASGDTGGRTIWPAVSPNVLGVGGTSLSISLTSGTYSFSSETAWSGSGGGYSLYEKEPTWQLAIQNTGRRASPDVAFDANPYTGFAVYDTYGYSGWYQIGGTSAGAPQWAGLIAIANQGRKLLGLSTLGSVASTLYSLYGSQYSADFHDITSGTAGRNRATTGYDLVTGLGSPYVQNIIAALTGNATSTAAQTKTTTTSGISSISIRDLSRHSPITAEFASFTVPAPEQTSTDTVRQASNLSPDASSPLVDFRISMTVWTALHLKEGDQVRATDPSARDGFTGGAVAESTAQWSRTLDASDYIYASNSLEQLAGSAATGDAVISQPYSRHSSSGHGLDQQTSTGAIDESAMPAPAAMSALSRMNSASLAFSQPHQRLAAVDQCLAAGLFDHAAGGSEPSAGGEKSESLWKLESLAGVLLAYGHSRVAKRGKRRADDDRHRLNCCR